MHTYQAVILVGGASTELYPLTAGGIPKVLLPIANETLLSFSLRTLEESGIQNVILVCAGEPVAARISSWLGKRYQGSLDTQVRAVPEEKGSAEALRLISDLLTADSILVVCGDTVTDVNLRALLATHYHHEATITALLTPHSSSPSADLKPGKAPKGVDYIGLDSSRSRILYLDSSREDRREVRIPLRALRAGHRMDIVTHLTDNHIYVIDRRTALSALQSKPAFASIQRDLIPYLIRHQQDPKPPQPPLLMARTSSEGMGSSASAGQEESRASAQSMDVGLAAEVLADLSHSTQAHRGQAWLCRAYVAPKEGYCIRARSLAAYGDANRELCAPDRAPQLLGRSPDERTGALVADGVQLGHKAVVGGGSLVGARTRLGDRTSVKRCVLGPGCTLGAGVKLDKCVLMEGVTVGDGAQLHGCIICANAHIEDRSVLRDCQVGADFTVPENADYRGEVLAKGKRPDLGRQSSTGLG